MWVWEAWGSVVGWKEWVGVGVSVGVLSPKDLSSLSVPGHPSRGLSFSSGSEDVLRPLLGIVAMCWDLCW